MTPEQIAALVAAEVEKATKALGAEMAASSKAESDALRAEIAKLTAKPPEPPAPKPGKQGEVSPEIAELREAVARSVKLAEDEKAARIAAEKSARSKETDAALSRHLQEHGIKPEVIPAVSLLIKSQMLAEKEDGSVFFRGTHPISKMPAEFSVEEGVKTWAASPDAAHYKAPRGVQGSGDRAGNSDPNQGQTFASLDDFYKQPA